MEAESELIEIDRRKAEHASQIRALQTSLAGRREARLTVRQAHRGTRRVDEARQLHETYAGHQEKVQAIEERVRRDFAHFRNAPESFQDDANAWIAETAERDRDIAALETEKGRSRR